MTRPTTGLVFEGRREALTYREWRGLGWDKPTAERLAREHEPGGPFAVVEAFLYCHDERMAVNRPASEQRPDGRSAIATRRDEFAFEWGYNGSGPHATARAILGKVLMEEPVPWLSQQFKQDVIALQPQDGGFVVTEGEVGTWADWTLATHPPPDSYPQARDQLETLAREGARARREARA